MGRYLSVLSDGDGASSLAVRPIASVPATPAERPVSVLLGDLGRAARQRARRADSRPCACRCLASASDPFRTLGPMHEIETPYAAALSRMECCTTFDMHPRDIATTRSRGGADSSVTPPVGFFVNALVTTRAVGIHDRREGLTPAAPLRGCSDQTRRGDANPQPAPWQACGYGAAPCDCRGPHVLQERGGGGALVLITLCGSRMPNTAWEREGIVSSAGKTALLIPMTTMRSSPGRRAHW